MSNRSLRCCDCKESKWHSQQQWNKLVSKWDGSAHKAKRNFRCCSCNSLKRNDPFTYQLTYGKPVKKMQKTLQQAFNVFLKDKNVMSLQETINMILSSNHIPADGRVVYHTDDTTGYLTCLEILGTPFIQSIKLHINQPRGKSY